MKDRRLLWLGHGVFKVQERIRSGANELEEHSQHRSTKDETHLEEAEVAALDCRQEWRRSVAQCIHMDAR